MYLACISQERAKQPSKKPPKPPDDERRIIFDLIESTFFGNFMTMVVVANIMTMTAAYHRMEENESFFDFYNQALNAFNMVYYAECLLKLIGLGPSQYFDQGWNRFDFALVALTLLDQLGLLALLPVSPNVLRVARIAPRIMRLMY